MKNIKAILEELDQYYTATRQAGHTTAMIEGIKNTDKCIVINHSMDMSNHIKRLVELSNNTPAKLISNTLNSDRSYLPLSVLLSHLKGTKKPLFIDNAALQEIFKQAHKKITELEDIIEDNRLEKINSELTTLLPEVKTYELDFKKPPLGLRPRKISDQARIVEICAAISRYAKSGLDIPTTWIDELNDITEYYCDPSGDIDE